VNAGAVKSRVLYAARCGGRQTVGQGMRSRETGKHSHHKGTKTQRKDPFFSRRCASVTLLMSFFAACKDFPSEESFSPSLLEFEISNLGCGRRPRCVSVVGRFFQNSFTAPVGTVRTRGLREASGGTHPSCCGPAYFSEQSPEPSCRFNRVNLDQRR